MKYSVLSATTLSILATSAFAGTAATRTAALQTTAAKVFGANETQFDVFGTYLDGKGTDHVGLLRDHGWGGGIGLNHFWTENFGLGIDVAGLHGRENPSKSTEDKTFIQGTGSFIVRVPYEEYNLAPYAYVGGGVTGRAGNWASAHGGVGIEYRLVPNAVGLFTDVRWTYYGDANGHGDINNFQARAGVRFAF